MLCFTPYVIDFKCCSQFHRSTLGCQNCFPKSQGPNNNCHPPTHRLRLVGHHLYIYTCVHCKGGANRRIATKKKRMDVTQMKLKFDMHWCIHHDIFKLWRKWQNRQQFNYLLSYSYHHFVLNLTSEVTERLKADHTRSTTNSVFLKLVHLFPKSSWGSSKQNLREKTLKTPRFWDVLRGLLQQVDQLLRSPFCRCGDEWRFLVFAMVSFWTNLEYFGEILSFDIFKISSLKPLLELVSSQTYLTLIKTRQGSQKQIWSTKHKVCVMHFWILSSQPVFFVRVGSILKHLRFPALLPYFIFSVFVASVQWQTGCRSGRSVLVHLFSVFFSLGGMNWFKT